MDRVKESPFEPLFARRAQPVVAGVAGGVADCLGIETWVVRAGVVIMTLGGGLGLLVYGMAYLLSGKPLPETKKYPPTRAHNVGFLFISAGMTVAGIHFFINDIPRLFLLRTTWLVAIVTVVVVVLVLGPWLLRLVNQVSEERRDRIRSEERADISAHLHDSVLNTLALIQRSEAKPEVVMLARRQERELRAWMQGRLVDENAQLDAAIDALATRIESQYNISVDAVVVGGEVAITEKINSFVAAVQEAAVNAARHSGVNTVSVYIEVEGNELIGYVRDQGAGFDRSTVGDDRRGITDSIEGRMRRAGGSAVVRSVVGEGTEVELHLSRT